MAQFGFQQPRYGTGTSKTMQPFSASIVNAASGAPTVGDPFGLLGSRAKTQPSIDGTTLAPKAPAHAPATPQGPVSTPPPAATPAAPSTQQQGPQATVPAYDINTDPALQQVNAYTGYSDEQAQALAQRQQRDLVVQTGLQKLAENLFPGDTNLAQAAAKNPTSTKAQIDTQNTKAARDLLTALTTGGHNLGYSGYRVDQEHELGNQYENALAQAAADAQARFDSIGSALRGTLDQNKAARASALGSAYDRAVQAALLNPPVGPQQGTTPVTDPAADPFGALHIPTVPAYERNALARSAAIRNIAFAA